MEAGVRKPYLSSSSLHLIAAFLLLTLLISCTTIPLPHSPREGLLIIPADIPWLYRGKEQKIIEVSFDIIPVRGNSSDRSNQDQTGTITIEIPFGKTFAAVSLPQGEYSISAYTIKSARFKSGENSVTQRFEKQLPLYLEKRSVQLFDHQLNVIIPGTEGGYDSDLVPMDNADRKAQIVGLLTADPRWTGWAEYTLVNFPEE